MAEKIPKTLVFTTLMFLFDSSKILTGRLAIGSRVLESKI